jgi:hemerythrin-like domain-containing protein
MSLKRHPALQPFSRDHLIGLFPAQKLIKLRSGDAESKVAETISAFADAWEREIQVHFADEDRLLGHLSVNQSSLRRLDEEHVELRELIHQILTPPHAIDLANRVGQMLDDHIRWEEHEFFPEIEQNLSEPELEALGQQTDVVEKSRRRHL